MAVFNIPKFGYKIGVDVPNLDNTDQKPVVQEEPMTKIPQKTTQTSPRPKYPAISTLISRGTQGNQDAIPELDTSTPFSIGQTKPMTGAGSVSGIQTPKIDITSPFKIDQPSIQNKYNLSPQGGSISEGAQKKTTPILFEDDVTFMERMFSPNIPLFGVTPSTRKQYYEAGAKESKFQDLMDTFKRFVSTTYKGGLKTVLGPLAQIGADVGFVSEKGLEKATLKYEQIIDEEAEAAKKEPRLQERPEWNVGVKEAFQTGAAKDPGYWANMVSQTVGQLVGTIPLVAAGSLLGPIGAAGGMAVSSYGPTTADLYEDLKNNGVENKTAARVSAAVGIPMAALDFLSDKLMLSKVPGVGDILNKIKKEATQEVAKYTMKKIASVTAKEIVTPAFTEGLTEGGQQIIQNVTVKAFNKERDVLEGALDSFVFGMVGGSPFGVMGGATKLGEMMESNKNIELKDQETEIMEGGEEMFQEEVSTDKNLKVIHNLTEEKLKKSVELGGLAGPSLAIEKAGTPHENRGEISFIGDKKLLESQPEKTEIYNADAYTPVVSSEKEFEFKKNITDLGDSIEANIIKANKPILDALKESTSKFDFGLWLESDSDIYNIMQRQSEKTGIDIDELTQRVVDTAYETQTRSLESVVRKMFEEGTVGKRSSMSVESIRDRLGSRFKDVESIDRSKLINDPTLAEDLYQKINDDYINIVGDIARGSKYRGKDSYENLREIDRVNNMIGDFLDIVYRDSKSFAKFDSFIGQEKGLIKLAKEDYKFDISEKDAKEIMNILESAKSLPRTYYEAKLTRGVKLNEFKAIAVPKGKTESIKKMLGEKGEGLDFIEYDPKIEGDRTNKIEQYMAENDLFFQEKEGEGEKPLKKIKAEEAIKKFQEKYPELSKRLGVEVVEKLVSPRGIDAFGKYSKGMLTFVENPLETTMDHEVFHAWFDIFTDPDTRLDLIKQIKKDKGYKSAVEAEEYMAREFEKYVKQIESGKKSTITGRIKEAFQDFWTKIKEFFTNKKELQSLFKDIVEENITYVKREYGSLERYMEGDKTEIGSLHEEARKYKSAEERINSYKDNISNEEAKLKDTIVFWFLQERGFHKSDIPSMLEGNHKEIIKKFDKIENIDGIDYFKKDISHIDPANGQKRGTRYVIAVDNGKIIGSADGDINGTIDRIGVDKNYRNKGIGSNIMKKIGNKINPRNDIMDVSLAGLKTYAKSIGKSIKQIREEANQQRYQEDLGIADFLKEIHGEIIAADPERQRIIAKIANVEAEEQRVGYVAGKKVNREYADRQQRMVEKKRESIITDIQEIYNLDQFDAYDKYEELRDVSYKQIEQAQESYKKTRRIGSKVKSMEKARIRGQEIKEVEKYSDIKKDIEGIGSEFIEPEKKELAEDFYEKNKALPKEKENVWKAGKKIWKDIISPISERLRRINPILATRLREFEFNLGINTKKDIDSIVDFIKIMKDLKKNDTNTYNELDLALKNSDEGKLAEISMKTGIEIPRDLLDAIFDRAKEVGFDIGYLKGYYPRVVLNSEGLLNAVRGTEGWGVISDAIIAREKTLGRTLTVEEKAEIANKLLQGFSVEGIRISANAFKERGIDIIDKELNKYYMDPIDALLTYVSTVNNAIEMKKFFGSTDPEESVGQFVAEMLDKKIIRPDQERDVANILKSRFNQKAVNNFISSLRTLISLTSMGSPISALSQLQDLANPIYKNGLIPVVKTWIKGMPIKMEDIGIYNIAEEFSDTTKVQKFTNTVFKTVGLHRLDRLGKETMINSYYDNLVKRAKKEPEQLSKDLIKLFGDKKRVEEIIKTLSEGKMDGDVKFLLFNEIMNFQPIALSEMPKAYLENPNMRIAYTLKTFTIKQLENFRREGLDVVAEGRNMWKEAGKLYKDGKIDAETYQDMKKEGKANVIKGTKQLLQLGVSLFVLGMGTDELKDFVMGRESSNIRRSMFGEELNIKGRIVDNLWRLLGLSKYSIKQGQDEGIWKTFISTVAPSVSFLDNISKDLDDIMSNITADEEKKVTWGTILQKLNSYQNVPMIGKLYYRWFGRPRYTKGGYGFEGFKQKDEKYVSSKEGNDDSFDLGTDLDISDIDLDLDLSDLDLSL